MRDKVLEALEGYRAVVVDAFSGWAVGWDGGATFEAVRVARPRAGQVIESWERGAGRISPDVAREWGWGARGDGQISADEALVEMRKALEARKDLHFALYPSDLPLEDDE
jgi:hypothetical protein